MIDRPAERIATRRLAWFMVGVLVLLLAVELFERRYSEVFAATTHRGLTKAAMYDRHPRVNILFLGSSRTQDGVSPDLVTRALQHVAPDLGELLGFNAAFTGSDLGMLVSIAPRFETRGDVRVAVIELSEPQVFNEGVSWETAEAPAASLEEKLALGLQHVAVVRYRKALIGANLGRLPSLLAAASMGGWETKGSEQFASWMGKREAPATGFDLARWRPEIFGGRADFPEESRPGPDFSKDASAAVDRLTTLAARYHSRGIIPIFAVPPMSASMHDAPERNAMRAMFAEVARRGQCEVWNFAALEPPESFFRDISHLNREGRAQYSEALAHEIARVLKAGGRVARLR